MSKIITLVNVNNAAYSNRRPLTHNDVANDLSWTFVQRNMNFEKDLKLKGKYCYHPFNTITIDSAGDVFPCICQAWLPISLGKIWDFDSLDDIVRTARAREIQASILDGSYRYCDDNTCGLLQTNALQGTINHKPDSINWINFAIDPSCNLTCPSCRKDFIFINQGPEYEKRMRIVDHSVKLIEQHDQYIKFSLSSDGDPFASLIYRDLLSKLNVTGKPVEIEIITNGILAKAHWYKLSGVHNNIVRFKVSFDAGSEQVYDIIRRGGDWNKLLDSCEFIFKWKQKNYSKMVLTANFVVQTGNYRDMANYVDLCDQLGFDEINFQSINDWSTFVDFKSHAVWQSTHPEHGEFLKQLHHPSLNNSKVNLTNLKSIKNATQ